MSDHVHVTVEGLYQQRVTERQCYLEEAFRSARLTIPSLIPDNQDIIMRNIPVVLKKPDQSLGARGVNSLASKLLLTLFPPTAPFMKYLLTGATKEEAEQSGTELSVLQSKLARREMRVQEEVDLQGIRSKAFLVLKQDLVAGNVMTYMDPLEGGLQVFSLASYTVKRDGRGRLLDLIYVEKLDRASVDDERILEILRKHPVEDEDTKQNLVVLYTRVRRTGKKTFESWQEIMGEEVPDSRDTHKEETLPWIVLRYTAIDGEDYGRGFVEEYRGDLTAYEQMSRDMKFASANAAKLVWAVNPNSPVKFKTFADVPNGGAVSASEGDIVAIRLDKGGDMAVAQAQLIELKKALSADFLLNSSFQRQQERVTAEEIRRLAEELEDTLGGVFSLLSQEFQLPMAILLEAGLVQRDPGFSKLPDGAARIGVVTGLAAIGRGQELNRLRDAVALVAEVEQAVAGVAAFVKPGNLSTRIWTGSGVDTEGLLFTEEEVEAAAQAAAQADAAKTLGEELASGAGTAVGGIDPQALAQGLQGAAPPQ